MLMEKAYGQAMRVVIKGTDAQCERLDKALWVQNPDGFLPHGTQKDPQPQRQPVYLTSELENPNDAQLLVIVDGSSEIAEGVERVFDVFDGGMEAEVQAARARWKQYLDAGYGLTYIRQKDNGGWEKPG